VEPANDEWWNAKLDFGRSLREAHPGPTDDDAEGFCLDGLEGKGDVGWRGEENEATVV